MTIINGIGIKDCPVHNLPVNRELQDYARKNRKAGNLAEIAFWLQVHRKHFHGLDFDRQKVIGNYIVDFYVKKLGLVVEIDGGSHNEKMEEIPTIHQSHILLPRPSGTPSKIEGELIRNGTFGAADIISDRIPVVNISTGQLLYHCNKNAIFATSC